MMILQQTRGVLSSGGFDPFAARYINKIESFGASVSFLQREAINNFYKSAKTDGYFSQIRRLYLPIWAITSPNAVDLITSTSGTFTSGVTHALGYVQGNGSTGYFTTGTASNTLIATESGMIGTLNFTGIPAVNQSTAASGGGFTATSARCGSGNSGVIQTAVWLGVNLIRAASSTSGILLSARLSGATVSGKRNSAGYSEDTTTAATTAVMGADNFIFMATNTFQGFSSNRIGAGFVTSGVDLATRQKFTLNLKTLWETCTGLTLP